MLTLKELNPKKFPTTPEIEANLEVLLERVNKIRALWNKSFTVTSGLRDVEDLLRIYRQKAERAGVPFDKSKVPMGSNHLKGAACDVADDGLILTAWLKANPKILEEAELWCEEGNQNWVHFSIFPPKSGKRWFLP